MSTVSGFDPPNTRRAVCSVSRFVVTVEGLGADKARLTLRVVRARLDRDRDGLLVFFVGVVLFCVAAAVYLLADLLVAAAPVVMLASGVAIASEKLTQKTVNSECDI